jgi:hypothetical protein
MSGDGERCCFDMQNLTYECTIILLEKSKIKALTKVPLYEHAKTNKERFYFF